MKKYTIIPNEAGSKAYLVENPKLIYLDTSSFIDIFSLFTTSGKKIFDDIRKDIADPFSILFSQINFLELVIKGEFDTGKNFALETMRALEYISISSANKTTSIVNAEIEGYLRNSSDIVRIFESNLDDAVVPMLNEALDRYNSVDELWFREKRDYLDSMNMKDRVIDLVADLYEVGVVLFKSRQEYDKYRLGIIEGKYEYVLKEKERLGKLKEKSFKSKTTISEKDFILKNAKERISYHIYSSYNLPSIEFLLKVPEFAFLHKEDFLEDIGKMKNINTAEEVKMNFPGLYWLLKVSYYNYYKGKSRKPGQFGDRNHAVYIPYCNYFSVNDKLIIEAIESEGIVSKKDYGPIKLYKLPNDLGKTVIISEKDINYEDMINNGT